MADASVGAGLALGNLATPDRQHVFTQAVQRAQQIDLAKEEKKAKKAAEERAAKEKLAGLIKGGEGGFSPFYAEQANKIASEGLYNQYDAYNKGNQIGIIQHQSDMKRNLDNLKMQDAQLKSFQEGEKQGILIPDEIKAALNKPYSQGNAELQKILKEKPEYNNIVNYNPQTGGYSFNPVKNIDLNKVYDTVIRENESNMTNVKKLKDVDNNTALYELSLDPKQIEGMAVTMASDPSFVANLKIKDAAKFNKELSAVSTQFPEISAQQAEAIAASKLAEEGLLQRNKKSHFDTKAMPSNGSGQIITSPSQGNAFKVTVQHPNEAGIEKDYPATGLYNAQVQMTSGTFPTSTAKDAKTGKPIESTDNSILLKSGNVQVLPFYKNVKSNLLGRIVPDQNVEKIDPNHLEYKPVLLGITEDDDQVVIEFDANNDVMNTLQKGNASTRKQTQYDVNQAFKIAQEANKNKGSRKSSTSTNSSKGKVSNKHGI